MNRLFIYINEFDKLWVGIFGDIDELRKVEELLLEFPKSGDVLPGTKGLRKLRWKIRGKGKRGGVRILYVDFDEYKTLFFITLLKKNEKENLLEADKKIINNLISVLKKTLEQNHGKSKN